MRRSTQQICLARLGVLAALLCLPAQAMAAQPDAEEEQVIGEVVVTAQRRQQPKLLHAGNIDRLDEAVIEQVQHQHIHELLNRVAGVWVVRGSGQEHLTAIRSPVLSGAGSCGGFLLLEDGIPVRPNGFCNVNQFIELITEQAASIEVIRGPGNALFGSNALHGIVNVLMPPTGGTRRSQLSLEIGANDYLRLRAALPNAQDKPWLATVVYADDGGFRDHSGCRQGKLHLKRSGALLGGEFTVAFSATTLRQDTAGFIFGEDVYKDPVLRRSNPNPEAFRDADSQRLYGIWMGSFSRFDLDVRPYLRHSDMQFLHHFLPGMPLEENGHISGGVVSAARFSGLKHQTVAGLDVEWGDVFLKQTQFEPTSGSAFLRETRPVGKHYDYEVEAISLAPFIQTEYQAGERITLGAGLRLESVQYDYRNLMLSGNTRDDGTECGIGGCLYSRPADRTDSFTNLAPKVSASFQLNAQTNLFASLARGFRAPQMTELYRLQNGQQVSDLDSERIDSFEVGVRMQRRTWSSDLVIYTMRKRDSVFRDAEGFNISGARSRHRGIETAADWQLNPSWLLSVDATYARHTYDFNAVGRGESFVAGRDIDSAPRLLGSIELQYEPTNKLKFGLQWTSLGEYYLDAQSRFRYPGHSLAHLRAGVQVTSKIKLVLRLNNITDELIADRADYGFGNYRYFPGRGRELFAEIRYSPAR